ncbi:MAG: PD-(D/E)XK nuclease family protein [Acidobacteria bacterium]|nr:PD-(D/E)XK nuclease family protein [Acidobacteriota bacterium]
MDRAAIDPGAMPRDDFEPLVETNPLIRVAVTGLGRDDAGTDLAPESRGDRSRVIVGRLVHRLFQAGARGDAARHVLIDAASRLLTEDERGAVLDRPASAEAAADLFSRMWLKADVRAVFDGAECLYEVPVSLRRPGGGPDGDDVVLRGVIDCVVQRPSGDVMVLDVKTGAERDADTQQLAAYVEAARALFPGAAVEGRLVYP